MKNLKIRFLIVCSVSTILLLFTKVSFSDPLCPDSTEGDDTVILLDTKVFPATMCRQIGGSNNAYYTTSGQITNPNDGSIDVICPIVRDAANSKWESIDVVVGDYNPADNIKCTAHSNKKDGRGWITEPHTLIGDGFYATEKGASQIISFYSQHDERNNGTFFVRCRLPGRSYVPVSTPNPNKGYGRNRVQKTNSQNILGSSVGKPHFTPSGIYSYSINEYSGCTDWSSQY